MAKILWITNFLHEQFPRCIRTRALMQHLAVEHEIHVLALDAKPRGSSDASYTGHQVQGTALGHWYARTHSAAWSSYSATEKCCRFLPKVAAKALSPFVFPDPMALHLRGYRHGLSRLLQQESFQVVIGCVVPFACYALSEVVKRERPDVQWVCDIGDPLLGNSVLSLQGHVMQRRAMRLEGNALKLADSVIVTNAGTKTHFLNHYGDQLMPQRIHVVPNGTNVTSRPPSLTDSVEEVTAGCRLVYAGGFYRKLREPYALFEAVRSMASKNVQLTVYGERTAFINAADFDGKTIRYGGRVANEEIHSVYGASDAVVFLDNAYGVQTSGKIFELIAAKRPILFIYDNEKSPTLELVKKYPAAVKCRNRPDDIRAAITQVMGNYKSFDYQFDLRPFLWRNRVKEFSKAIGLAAA